MPDIWTVWLSAAQFIIYATAMLSAGSVLFVSVFDEIKTNQICRKVGLLSAAVLLIVAPMKMGLQAGYLVNDGAAGMFDPSMLGIMAAGPLGMVVLMRIISSLMILLAFAAFTKRGVDDVFIVLGISGAGAVLGSFSFVGHIPTDEIQWLPVILFVHLTMASFWIGALMPLRVVATDGSIAGPIVHTFGLIAIWTVLLLFIAGTILLWNLLGGPLALFKSEYGQSFLIKLVAFTALLALAAMNRLRLTPKLLAQEASAAPALRRSITLELIAVTTVLAATALATTTFGLP